MKRKLHNGELFKRVLSAVLTLVMLLSLAPVIPHAQAAEGTQVYLKPNSNWLTDGARFAIYYWNDSGSNWTGMSDTDGDGYYEGTVPAGYSNVIFCRMNPGTTENNWDNKWNQTSDLMLPTDGGNCYTVADGTWDNGGGEWSKRNVAVSYSVSYQLTNVESSNTVSSIDENTAYTTTLTAEEGYGIDSVSVTVGGAAADFTYDSKTGTLTVSAVTGDMVITAVAEELTYLVPNSNWLMDGARFAVYCFNDSSNAWLDMEESEEEGYYQAIIPEGYTKVIFCRMNPGTTENNWDNKWNQTGDLTLPEGDENCYTVPDGAWDGSDNTNWSVYPEEEEEGGDEGGSGETETPDTPAAAYYVAGDAAICGTAWSCDDAANQMTHVGSGIYEKVYTGVAAGTYNIKVTDGTWNNSWGDGSANYTFVVSAACDVTVSFDSNAKTVSVTGDSVGKETGLDVTSMYVVGNGSGAWLNGASWNPGAAENAMTEVSDNVYEITYEDVPAGSAYEFKFAANGDWTHSWGGGGAEGEAVYNGQNITLAIEYELADVTMTMDMTGYDHGSKNGAKYSVTVTEAVADPAEDYYLIGFINGADYGCEADWENLGEYKFVSGKLTATFTQDSYVFIKTGDNNNWYLAESYCTDSTVTLAAGNSEKLFVPGNTELTFTLTENSDGTLTLSYTAASSGEDVEIPEGYTAVRIHFFKTEGWGSAINAYVWTAGGALKGYEDYNTWPGKAVSANKDHAGWYDLIVATETPTAFNFIFNDGGNQTADLSTGDVTGDTELWVVGNDVMTTAPGEWSGDYDYTANIHFQKPEGWGETINAWIWDASGAIPGYEQYQTTWPGSPIEADTINAGWYNVSVTVDENTGFSFILNDGTNQTADLSTGTLQVKTDIWVVDGAVQTAAPDGWMDPNRKVYVPGTFPGPSWDAGSNQMTYDAELGLYVYTFEDVPAANYEFKIAINGSWNENYGANGAKDGANIAVAVPETMDVTVYYNDNTNYAVTNVTYVFADITLSGTGIPEGTKLTDKGLSGIYTVTIPMAAGIYTDVKITCDGKDYTFDKIEVEEDKDVTFYMDPVTELYYNNANGDPIDTASIYFNSKDTEYKSVFGAVATGEEVTFSIDTGSDITSAVLLIQGVGSYPMTAEETSGEEEVTSKRWSCTTSLSGIGEYDYYFALSNGSTVMVYGDDDGYYGEGIVCELTNVMPYDLVVYKAGFETPEWMKNAVIYQIFPDRFFDGDSTNNQAQTWARGEVDYEYIADWYTLPENPEQETMLEEGIYKATGAWFGDGEWSNEIYGGDLKGITQRIGYLKALGVNVIYLNPVFWSISNHRYDAVDYTEIDPILGTLGDFEQLVSVAEANGMHIILDGVFNHVSDDSVYFDRYYKFLGESEKIGAYPYWAYVYDYMAENGVDQAAAETAAKAYFSENYGITDYSYTAWFAVSSTTMAGTVDNIGLRAGKEVYSYEGWWGYDSMPVIYSTNGSEYQTGNWAQEIISGSGSVTQYWISKGNNGWRLDVANEVSDETWQRFRESVKGLNSDAVIIGEIWDDATKYLKGDMYDSVMNYLFRNAVTGFAMGTNAETTTNELERIRERYPEEAFYAMMNLVGSHDTTRLLSYLDGIGDDRADKSLAAAFPTYESTSSAAKQRQYLVAFLQFTYPGAPTIYYGDEIGMVGADDPDDRRAMEWGKGNKELVEWYAKLAAIRKAYPALSIGDLEVIETGSSNLMGYKRTLNGQSLIVVANNSASDVSFIPEEGYGISYTDIVTGNVYATTTGYTVPARSGVILVPTGEVKDVQVNTAGLAPAYDASYIVAERDPSASHTHSYTTETVNATCTEAGSVTYTCECGDTYTEVIEALGHTWDKGTVTEEATCTEKGSVTYTCTVCGETRTEEIPAAGHSYSTKPVWKWSSDYTSATATFECSCGDKQTVTATKKAGTIVSKTTDATCTKTGETVYTAAVIFDGETYTDTETVEIPKTAHTYKNGSCTVCGADQSSASTGDMIRYAVILLVVAGAALVVLLILKKRSKK